MSISVTRVIITSTITTAIATGLSTQILSNANLTSTTDLTTLAVMFFAVSIVSALVPSNKGAKKVHFDQPNPLNSDNSRETGTV